MKSKAEQAMELPLNRLVRGTMLLQDLARVTGEDSPPRWAGLMFLADALHREATTLERLYHGEEEEAEDG